MLAKRLISIVKLRRAAVDEAQRFVTECLAAETRAETHYHNWESKIWRETEAASALEATDLRVSAFANWLPDARRQLTNARTQHERTSAETSGARAHLAASRAALSVIEELWNTAQKGERTAADARLQSELDQLIHAHPRRAPAS